MIKFTQAKQDSLLVRFLVDASNLPDTAKVYIAGNQPQLGNWQPDQVALQKQSGTNIWSAEFRFPPGQILEYKFTKGQWSVEAVNEDGTIPPNNILKVKEDTTLFTVIKYWKDAFQYKIQGQITGTVCYHQRVEGLGFHLITKKMLNAVTRSGTCTMARTCLIRALQLSG
jgi:hypothetical protein